MDFPDYAAALPGPKVDGRSVTGALNDMMFPTIAWAKLGALSEAPHRL